MGEITLRRKMGKILGAFFAFIALFALGSIYGYSILKKTWTQTQTAYELKRTITVQAENLLPSFLLPEQKTGASLLLKRIKSEEQLQHISIVDSASQIPNSFVKCPLDLKPVSCLSKDGNSTAVIAPVENSGSIFGYLIKIKKNDDLIAGGNWIEVFGIISVFLLISFLVLFWFLARLISKAVPKALDDLLQWIEADLQENEAKPTLHLEFKELQDLRKGISGILERYDRARDQAVIGQLTSGIMHDIKTPLASIVAAMLLVQEQPKDSPKRESRLENLFEVCKARLPIIGQIIETTLDGSRDIHIEKESLDLKSTIQNSIFLTRDLVQKRKATIEFLEINQEIAVFHDPIQLSRVFTNLIKNGVEAISEEMPSSGHLKISLMKSSDNQAVISFEDNGPGLTGNPEKIFRVFRSSKVHGTGLGLLISKKIIDAHNGSIKVSKSETLLGAKFEIRMPLQNNLGVAT